MATVVNNPTTESGTGFSTGLLIGLLLLALAAFLLFRNGFAGFGGGSDGSNTSPGANFEGQGTIQTQ